MNTAWALETGKRKRYDDEVDDCHSEDAVVSLTFQNLLEAIASIHLSVSAFT